MKKYSILALPDGEKVIVDREAERNVGDHYVSNGLSGLNIFVWAESQKKKYPLEIGKIIFTIGFALPNVEEIEIISGNETETLSLGFGLFVYQCAELAYKREKEKRTDSEDIQRETVLKMFDKYKSDINYKTANKNFTEADIFKILQKFHQTVPKPDYFQIDKWLTPALQSLTRPDISEVFIEYEQEIAPHEPAGCDFPDYVDGKIISITAKDGSGKEIKIRVKK
jgi:hypothetical protein